MSTAEATSTSPTGSSGRRSSGPRWPPCSGRTVRWSVHSQADDYSNEFRRDTDSNYKHELDESNKNKKRAELPGLGHDGHDGRDDGRRPVRLIGGRHVER